MEVATPKRSTKRGNEGNIKCQTKSMVQFSYLSEGAIPYGVAPFCYAGIVNLLADYSRIAMVLCAWTGLVEANPANWSK